MGKTSIEWTDASWNPIVGCTEISPGCANCYAARLAATRLKNTSQYKDLADSPPRSHGNQEPLRTRWNGEVRFLPERLEEPLHWRKPRKIFVCDMGDLFHYDVNAEWILKVWGMMACCPQHTFQILTKRADRMQLMVSHVMNEFTERAPLKNVWLGVSVENQHFADERIPLLLATPAVVRWISAEPLLGPIKLKPTLAEPWELLRWVVCGGESGPNARPMHPDWARSLRDQCVAAGVPFFFKQWGEWFPANGEQTHLKSTAPTRAKLLQAPGGPYFKFGKHAAGRLLDGREWNEFPKGGAE